MTVLAAIGHASLFLACGAVLLAGVLLVLGAARDDARLARAGLAAAHAFAGLVLAASLALWAALLGDDFSLKYVAATSRTTQPLIYKIGAFWSGQEGSFLFWLLILAGYMVAGARWARRAAPDLLPWALAVQCLVGAFFAFMTAFAADPFATYPAGFAPPEGRGLMPLLRDPGMLGHPVFLFLGYVGLVVPFSFAVAALILGRPGSAWLGVTRLWTMTSWLFLTAGIVLGGWWAYRELGWGGFWAWDPVENASLMPWLVATAFFHSAMVEERRGLLRLWNVALVMAAFLLTILGTFIVRSGILQSVHAFAESEVGPWFLAFLGLLLAGCLYLVAWRYPMLADPGGVPVLSREGSFLVNNLILVALAATVFIGTLFPLAARAFGSDLTIGAPYFNRQAGPLFAALLLLMGVCPLLAWRRAAWGRWSRLVAWPAGAALALAAVLALAGLRQPGALAGFAAGAFTILTVMHELSGAVAARARATGERGPGNVWRLVSRNPRRWGGYLVHVGIALMGLAVVGFHYYQQTAKVGARAGETFALAGYTFEFLGVQAGVVEGDVLSYTAPVVVRRGERLVGVAHPALRVYPGWEQQTTTEAAILPTPAGDLYLVLAGFGEGGQTASFEVYWNPLMLWLWAGALLAFAGTAFALWPRRRPAVPEEERRLLAELSELEYDYRMGKIGEEEYRARREELTAPGRGGRP